MHISFTQHKLDPEIFTFSNGDHRGLKVIWIHFPFTQNNNQLLKTELPGAKWSQTQKKWYLPILSENPSGIQLPTVPVGKEVLGKIHPENQKAFNDFINCLKLKAYSQNTIRTYTVEFAQLLAVLKHHKVEELTKDRLQSYFLYCINDLKLSENYVHSRINAIKFYYEKVLHRPKMFLDIPRPKKPLLLPKSLSADEVKRIIKNTENLKHRVIIKLCYGMGLRVSEVVNLKIEDIDSGNLKVFVSRGKGKKDRYVNLPESILEELREYYKVYRPKTYLFEGINGDQYAVRSVQNVFKNAMRKAGIRKTVGIHSLRHSYATHLLELGTDISYIQKLMGHNSITTTLGYTKVADSSLSAVQSPLDRLKM